MSEHLDKLQRELIDMQNLPDCPPALALLCYNAAIALGKLDMENTNLWEIAAARDAKIAQLEKEITKLRAIAYYEAEQEAVMGEKFVYNEDDLPGQRFDTYDEQYVRELQDENRKLQEQLDAAKTRDAWPVSFGEGPPIGSHNDLVKRLRYYDLYIQVRDQEKTIFGQAADTITLLQKALAAMEELAAEQDRTIRKLEKEAK